MQFTAIMHCLMRNIVPNRKRKGVDGGMHGMQLRNLTSPLLYSKSFPVVDGVQFAGGSASDVPDNPIFTALSPDFDAFAAAVSSRGIRIAVVTFGGETCLFCM